MNRPAAWKSWLLPSLLLAVVWAALVILFAAQFVLAAAVPWEEALGRAATFWMPWLALLPLTYLLTRLLLQRRVKPVWSVLIHLLTCGMAVVLCHYSTPERPDRAERSGGYPPDGGGPPDLRGGEGPGPPWNRGPHGGPPPRREDRGRPRGLLGPFGFRSIIDIVVYGGVASLTYALGFLRRSQERERRTLELEASLARARLDALRLQINPHFLFNTLNAIASLIHSRPDDADEMIGSLSELLRASLLGAGDHETTLARELETLRLFTDIERTRFGDRIRFSEDIAADTMSALLPSLILQPLVENAIRHGLEPQTGQGTVSIQAKREGSALIIIISDDGAGYDPSKPAPAGTGIGLANTRDRLHALYGGEQSLAIAPAGARGTSVTLRIPWHTA